MDNKESSAFKRGYEWAKKEVEKGRTEDEIDAYLCGPDRNDFDYGVEEYLRTLNSKGREY